jgi:hypothetical protein
MEVTGYMFRHTLRELTHQRDIAAGQFSESLYAFEGDDTPHPDDLMSTYSMCEAKIAQLQTAQHEYNLRVKVEVQGREMSLSEAVKRVGGAGRAEKMWRSCAKDNGRDRYSRRETTRKADEERAVRQVSITDAMNRAKAAAKFASALRMAIETGNATKIEIEGLDPALFD